jgi:hypothetical protein
VSRLSRFSTRAYGRLSPEQKQALDRLEWLAPGPAGRGEAKTVLGWRRTRDETVAYALELLDEGLVLAAVASRLRIGERYLRRLLDEVRDPENRPRNRSGHPAKVALTDRGKVIGRGVGEQKDDDR